MEQLLGKLSSYNIFNNLLPGALYCAACERLGLFVIADDTIFGALLLYYIVGLAIGRVGSVVLDPPLERLGIIKWSKYDDFVAASNSDKRIDMLVETSNTYRAILSTIVALMLTIAVSYARRLLPPNDLLDTSALLFVALALFLLAYRKQSAFISRRVEISKHSSTQK